MYGLKQSLLFTAYFPSPILAQHLDCMPPTFLCSQDTCQCDLHGYIPLNLYYIIIVSIWLFLVSLLFGTWIYLLIY